jgi:two-component system, LytTR family, sensor kinase
MAMASEDTAPLSLKPRIVLISIVCFWMFYFSIVTVRWSVLGYSGGWQMLAPRTLVSIASIGVTYLFYLVLRKVSTTSQVRTILIAFLLAIPAALTYSAVNWFIFDRWPWEHKAAQSSKPAPAPPPAAGAAGAPAQTVAVGQMQHDEEHMTLLQGIADTAVNGYFFFVAWAALYLALCYAAEVGALERRTAKLRAATQAAELRALRYQVNPHFLFNTLNSLSTLVLTGKRDEAERMIINLSTFFRTSLNGDPSDDVRLSEEILLQRLYLDIETVRFPDRLVVDIDVPEALRDACVPGLILQPLVENAVKYGVSRAKRPVTIRIHAAEQPTGLLLLVEDDGNPAPAMNGHANGTGVGLQNVRDRLVARFGDAGDCRWDNRPGGGFAVTLTMPLVRNGCC